MKGLKQYKSINEYKSYFESSLLMVYLIFLDDSPLPITKVNLYRDKVKSAADPQLTAIKLWQVQSLSGKYLSSQDKTVWRE